MIVANTTAQERPAAVYRLFDEARTLLYIGSAYDPEERCKDHRGQPWWSDVVRRTDELHPSRQDAYLAEMEAIARERPRHNVNGTPQYAEECRHRAATDPQHQARVRAGSAAANGASREVVEAILRGDLKSWGPRTGPVAFP